MGGSTIETLTLMFTDIEGSTALVRQLGADWGDVLDAHHAIVGGAVQEHGGCVVDVEGDGCFASFTDAAAAVGCATDIHHRLAAHPWPGDVALRVRIGLHCGSVERRAGRLLGLDVHKAARISAAAQGGQTLLSETTVLLAGSATATRDLGVHRLKDIPGGVRLFDVDDGVNHPPPRTVDSRVVRLPSHTDDLVGRDSDIEQVTELLASGARFVTLVGPAGVGKTTLAIAAADQVAEAMQWSAVFVPLADVGAGDGVLPMIARRVEAEGAAVEEIAAAVAGTPCLLILDNFEHVRQVARIVTDLVEAARDVRLLVTSQAALRLPGERRYDVRPLALPSTTTAEDVLASVAAQLFWRRATEAAPDLVWTDDAAAAVAAIVRRLEGNALALELAAARCRSLTLHQLVARLDDAFSLLRTREESGRHSSLETAFRWTFELLPPDAQQLLAGCSVFSGGATLELLERVAARAGAAMDVIWAMEDLIDLSLIRSSAADGRFAWAAAVQDLARRELTANPTAATAWATAHAEELLDLAAAATEDEKHERLLVDDASNFMQALVWTREHRADLHTELVGRSGPLLRVRGNELGEHIAAALDTSEAGTVTRARVLTVLAGWRYDRGDCPGALHAFARADDAWAVVDCPYERAEALVDRAFVAGLNGDPTADSTALAEGFLDQADALLDAAGCEMSRAVYMRVQLMVVRNDRDAAQDMLRRLNSLTATGADEVAHAHLSADCALLAGDYPAALATYARSFQRSLEVGLVTHCSIEAQGMAMALGGLGRYADARQLLGVADRIRDDLEFHPRFAWWERLHDEYVNEPAEKVIGAKAAAEAFRRGHELSLELAIHTALGATQ